MSARPMRSARRVQPSNGTCGSMASMAASRSGLRSGGGHQRPPAALGGRRGGTRQFLGEAEQREILHPHRIQDAVQVVVFVLHHAGVEAGHLALDRPAVAIDAAIADARRARHGGAQAGDGQAALPAEHAFLGQQLDLGVDHHGVADRRVVRRPRWPRASETRNTNSRSGTCTCGAARPAPRGVLHGLHHVGDQAADLRVRRDRSTGSHFCNSTGWPMRAIFRMAIEPPRLALG